MATNLATVIKDKLDARHMTVRDLERQANLKRSVVHNIISGKSKQPNADTLLAIATAFGCTVDALINRKDEEEASTHVASDQNDLQYALYDGALARDCLETVITLMLEQKKEPSASLFWSIVQDTYYYSSLGSEKKKADKKYAEWLIWQKLR
jgi:transcriptional regulator with XRE-family HTH domain